MQTLWSRLASFSGAAGGSSSACKCPQCLSGIGITTRRVGASASASAARRAPKYITSSTLWYSGIFAAAATIDAGAKVRRREKWDAAIAGVREELGRMEGEGKTAVDAEGEGEGRMEGEGGVDAEGKTDGQEDVLDGNSMEGLEDAFGELEPTFKQPRWPTNTGPELVLWNLAPESIYADGKRREKGEVRAWTPKKVEIISLSLELLQLRILISLVNRGMAEEAALAVPEGYAKLLQRSAASLHAQKSTIKNDFGACRRAPASLEGYERTSEHKCLNAFNESAPDGRTYQAPKELNLALQSLLKQHKRQTISTPALLARICYNLSASPLPPNLDTYNTLLLGLSAANLPETVTHVIRSLHQTNLRPNETSLAALLHHHTQTSNSSAFTHLIQKMRGAHNGLALARPDIRITSASAGRLTPHPDDPAKTIQLPYPTPKVFAALIAGVTRFGGFDTALGVCKSMGDEGWGLCMSGLEPLLRDCAERRDWEAGISVWRQVRALEAKSKRQGSASERRSQPEKIPLRVYACMLRLCLGSGEKGVYDEVWAQATKAYRQHGARILTNMIRSQMGLAPAEKPAGAGDKAESTAPLVFDAAEQLRRASEEFTGEVSEANKSSEVSEASGEGEDGAARVYAASKTLRELRNAQRRHSERQSQSELLQGQLNGSLPASEELERYEFAERPMYADAARG